MKIFKYTTANVALATPAILGFFAFSTNDDLTGYLFLLLPFVLPFYIFFSKESPELRLENIWKAFFSFFIAYPVALIISSFGVSFEMLLVFGIFSFILYGVSLLVVTYILNLILGSKKQNGESKTAL